MTKKDFEKLKVGDRVRLEEGVKLGMKVAGIWMLTSMITSEILIVEYIDTHICVSTGFIYPYQALVVFK